MRGPCAGEALGPGFDHGAEIIAPQSLLLMQVGSDGFHAVGRTGFRVAAGGRLRRALAVWRRARCIADAAREWPLGEGRNDWRSSTTDRPPERPLVHEALPFRMRARQVVA